MPDTYLIRLTERERELVTSALWILNGQCANYYALDHDIARDLGGIPDPEDVWALKEAIEATRTN